MKKYQFTFFLLLFSFSNVLAQYTAISSPITLIANLKPKERFSIIFDGYKTIDFINIGQKDTVVSKYISSTRSISLRYGIQYTINNINKYIFHTFYLNPSDTVYLAKSGQYDITATDKLKHSIFIDDWIQLKDYLKPVVYKKEAQEGIISYNNVQFKQYQINAKIIDSLAAIGVINQQIKHNWNIANELNYDLLLLAPINVNNIGNLPVTFNLEIERIMGRLIDLQQLKTDEIHELVGKLCRYNLLKAKKDPNNKLNLISYYIEHSDKIGPLTTIILTDILSNISEKTSLVYKEALQSIKHYAIKKDPRFFNQLNGIDKNFTLMHKVMLNDLKGNTTTLKNVFEQSSARYFLIDMWASWCVPCRQQLPDFEKFKTEIKQSDILFLSISIDKYETDWIKATIEEKINTQQSQFRLLDYAVSPLTQFFDIGTIPRYLVLTKKGEVVNYRFYLPSDKEFKSALLKLLN